MSQTAQTSKDPDIIASFKALRRAARRALEIGLATGTPVYVMKNGKIVDLTEEVAGRRRTSLAVREKRAAYGARKPRQCR